MSRPTTPTTRIRAHVPPQTPLPPAASPLPPFSPPSPSISASPAPSPRRGPHVGDTITVTQVSLDQDGDLVFVFDTSREQYGLVLPLTDVLDLTWKETQAIVDALRLSTPGKSITVKSFEYALKTLEHRYGSSKGPVRQEDGRYCGAFYPVRGTIANHGQNDPNMIESAMLRMDTRDRRIVILAHTRKESVYSVRIGLRGEQGKIDARETSALIDILSVLEPGDIVNEHAFSKFSGFLERRYGHARFSLIKHSNLTICNIDINPSPRRRRSPPQLIKRPTRQHGTPGSSIDHYVQPSPPSTPGGSSSIQSVAVSPGGSTLMRPCPYPGFTYQKLIADSGQAKVYLGVRDSDQLRVAIKVFHLDDDSTEAYKTELRLLLKMSPHDNVVSVVDFFEHPHPALVTEYINGIELGEYIQRNGSLNQRDGIPLSIAIAKGLCHLHKHGIVHRDLKSGNVLVTRTDPNSHLLTPVIIDLGLSSVFPVSDMNSSQVSKNMVTKEVKGTPLWMAPEMILRREWSDKTDVYAFGMILWELFSGVPPFVSELPSSITQMELLVQVANGKRPNIERICPVVDGNLKALIVECWNTEPKDRPSMRRVLDSLSGDDPKVIFERHDLNKNGELEYHEFVMFLQFYAPQLSPRQTSALFETIDDDHSGEISYAEFERFWRQVEIAGIESVISRGSLPTVVSLQNAGPGIQHQDAAYRTPSNAHIQQKDQPPPIRRRQQQDLDVRRERTRPLASLLRDLCL